MIDNYDYDTGTIRSRGNPRYPTQISLVNKYYILSPRQIYNLEKVDNWKLECMLISSISWH